MTLRHLPFVLVIAGIAAAGRAGAQDAAAGAATFKSQCAICHAVAPDKNQVGPSLFGIVGRPAGISPGYRYSAATRNSGLTWDTETLDRYVTSPATVIEHTSMTYGGLRDPRTRADLIAYLSTLQ